MISKEFDFSTALLQAVMIKGASDHLDNLDVVDASSPLPLPASLSPSPLSSPLSSPPTSPLLPILDLTPTRPQPGQGKQKWAKAHSKKNQKQQQLDAAPKTAAEIPARSDPVGHFVPSGSAFQVHSLCRMMHQLLQHPTLVFKTRVKLVRVGPGGYTNL